MLSQFVVIPPSNKYSMEILSYVRPRRDRRAYISERDLTIIPFALIEPKSGMRAPFCGWAADEPWLQVAFARGVRGRTPIGHWIAKCLLPGLAILCRWTHSLGCWASTLLRSG